MHAAQPHATVGSMPDSQLSRRQVLVRSGQGLLALVALGAVLPGCGTEQSPGPDPLEPELAAARSDAALASAAADAAMAATAGQATPELVPALRVIADERTRHATALEEEVARAAGRPTPAADSPEAAGAVTTAPAPTRANPPPGFREVAEALRRSADSAAKLVPTLSGYRAGLVGSIAAACTAAHTVGLAPMKQAR